MQSYTDRGNEHKPREGTEIGTEIILYTGLLGKEHKPREGTEMFRLLFRCIILLRKRT